MTLFRAFIAFLFSLCTLYFIVGAFFSFTPLWTLDNYLRVGGAVGAIASVLGLLALLQKGIRPQDVKELEPTILRSLADASEQVQALEHARAETKAEIDTLTIQKQEMELLVRQASTRMFLREQYRLYEEKLREHVENNRDIKRYLDQLVISRDQLHALDEEVQASPHIGLLQEIIAPASQKITPDILLLELSPLGRILLEPYIVVGWHIARLVMAPFVHLRSRPK